MEEAGRRAGGIAVLLLLLAGCGDDGRIGLARSAPDAGVAAPVPAEAPEPPPAVSSWPFTDCVQERALATQSARLLADGTVSALEPQRTLGLAPTLQVGGSEGYSSYLRFEVPPDSGRVTAAQLRLHAESPAAAGLFVYAATAHRWDEPTLSYGLRPQLVGEPVAQAGGAPAAGWLALDVTAAVKEAGWNVLALSPASPTQQAVVLAAREAGAAREAQLRVTTEDSFCAAQGVGGEVGWTRAQGTAGDEALEAVAATPGGGVVAVGRQEGGSFGGERFTGASGLVLARYGPDGAHLWSRSFGEGLRGAAIAVAPDGDLLVAGQYWGSPRVADSAPLPTAAQGAGLFVARFTPDGEHRWARGFTAQRRGAEGALREGRLSPRAVASDAAGSLLVAVDLTGETDFGGGAVRSHPAALDGAAEIAGVAVVKLAPDGRHQWSYAVHGGTTGSSAGALAATPDGDVLLGLSLGYAAEPALRPLDSPGLETPAVLRLSAAGALRWSRLLRGVRGGVWGVAATAEGGVAFAGAFSAGRFTFAGKAYASATPQAGGRGPQDAVVGMLSRDGADVWARDLPGRASGAAGKVAVDAAGRLTVQETLDPEAAADVRRPLGRVLSRYGPSGEPLGSRRFEQDLVVQDFALHPSGSVTVAGAFRAPASVGGTTAYPQGGWDLMLLQLLAP